MNSINKFSTFEAISMVVIIMLNNIILNMPADIIKNTSSGAWVNVLFISILAVIFIVIIYNLFKSFPSMDILDISKFLGGNTLKFIVGIAFIAMFLIGASASLRLFVDLIQLIFLVNTPLVFIIAFFILGAIIANKVGIGSMGKVTSIAIIMGIISFIILIISSSGKYNSYNLFPILGYGPEVTFLSGVSNIYAFAGLAILYFIKPALNDEKDFNKVCIISTIVSGILLLLCILNQILLFGVIFDSELLAGMVLSSRILNFGNFFERVDAIFTFIWIFSQISTVSIASCLILYILKKILNLSDQNGVLYSVMMLIFAICVFPKNLHEVINSIMPISNVIKCIVIFIIPPILLILANLKFKGKYLKKGKNNG